MSIGMKMQHKFAHKFPCNFRNKYLHPDRTDLRYRYGRRLHRDGQ